MSDVPRDPPEEGGEDDLENPEIDESGQGDEILGDDADDEAVPAEEDEGSQESQREVRQTRGESRQARLSREASELRERLARAEGERDALRQTGQRQPQFDPQAQARADAEFYQSLESMSHIDAMRAVENRATQRIGMAMQQQRIQDQDNLDRRDFAVLSRTDRNAARFKAQVDDTAQRILAMGQVPNREEILNNLVGREVRERSARILPQQRRAAAARVAQQTTRPAGGRGDVARGAGRARNQDEADEALLRSVTLEDLA